MMLAETIALLRKGHGMTLEQMADLLQCSPSYLSKIENNCAGCMPSDRFLRRVSEEFALDFEDLVLQSGRLPDMMQKQVATMILCGNLALN